MFSIEKKLNMRCTKMDLFLRKSHYGYQTICYYKRYGIWPFICFVFAPFIFFCAVFRWEIDEVFCYLMTIFGTAVTLSYTAHSDKERRNRPIFKARRECFDALESIVGDLFRSNTSSGDNVQEYRQDLIDRGADLCKKANVYFNDEIDSFFVSVKFAIITYIFHKKDFHNGGLDQLSKRNYLKAVEYLGPFIEDRQKFYCARKEFELNMFKPKKFAPIVWAKSFDAVLKE